MPAQCVVLAGGLGTRMRPITETIPKALIPVAGRPFVDWQLRLLSEQGVEEVVFCIGHLGEMLRDWVGEGARWGVTANWVDEGDRLRGTAGALRLALDRGALADDFFVLYGDSYLPIDMRAVRQAWQASGQPALMTVLRNEGRWDTSNAIFRNGLVALYDKRRPAASIAEMHWIDYGLSILNRDVIATHVPAAVEADLSDLMHELSRTGRLAGYEVFERFYEIGSQSGLRDLETYLNAGSGKQAH
jgi:NDP-sugar pyrophosphorylase family protein